MWLQILYILTGGEGKLQRTTKVSLCYRFRKQAIVVTIRSQVPGPRGQLSEGLFINLPRTTTAADPPPSRCNPNIKIKIKNKKKKRGKGQACSKLNKDIKERKGKGVERGRRKGDSE